MTRTVIAGLIVTGLAVGIWWLWPSDDDVDPVATTIPVAVSTSTTIAPPTTTTSTTQSTTSSVHSHVVTTVEEAETILRELWFGWFEGIYNQDLDRIREVVATQEMLDAAQAAFETIAFSSSPNPDGIHFVSSELLKRTESCIAMWSESSAGFVAGAPTRSGVDVLRFADGAWRFATSWKYKNDLWEADCDAALLPLP